MVWEMEVEAHAWMAGEGIEEEQDMVGGDIPRHCRRFQGRLDTIRCGNSINGIAMASSVHLAVVNVKTYIPSLGVAAALRSFLMARERSIRPQCRPGNPVQ